MGEWAFSPSQSRWLKLQKSDLSAQVNQNGLTTNGITLQKLEKKATAMVEGTKQNQYKTHTRLSPLSRNPGTLLVVLASYR